MVRTIVQLTEEQAEKLKRISRESGRSVAALVRDAVDRLVDEPSRQERWERARSAVGKFKYREGALPVGRQHDRYLGEDFRD